MGESNVATQPAPAESDPQRIPAPCAMVIFGASGDLTERKLVPALYYLSRAGLLPDGFSVIGCAKTPYTDESFRDKMRKAVKKYLKVTADDEPALDSFTRDVHY
ncbi:MAG: glucose-6-phosphate dehydrogenase, partial [Terriglobia bacterium]